jgi:hypothetical protein
MGFAFKARQAPLNRFVGLKICRIVERVNLRQALEAGRFTPEQDIYSLAVALLRDAHGELPSKSLEPPHLRVA